MKARTVNIGKITIADSYRIIKALELSATDHARKGDPTERAILQHIAQNFEALVDEASGK